MKLNKRIFLVLTRITKVKLEKLEGKINIYKYRVSAHKIEYQDIVEDSTLYQSCKFEILEQF